MCPSYMLLVTRIYTGYIPTCSTDIIRFPRTKSFLNIQYTRILTYIHICQYICQISMSAEKDQFF